MVYEWEDEAASDWDTPWGIPKYTIEFPRTLATACRNIPKSEKEWQKGIPKKGIPFFFNKSNGEYGS